MLWLAIHPCRSPGQRVPLLRVPGIYFVAVRALLLFARLQPMSNLADSFLQTGIATHLWLLPAVQNRHPSYQDQCSLVSLKSQIPNSSQQESKWNLEFVIWNLLKLFFCDSL